MLFVSLYFSCFALTFWYPCISASWPQNSTLTGRSCLTHRPIWRKNEMPMWAQWTSLYSLHRMVKTSWLPTLLLDELLIIVAHLRVRTGGCETLNYNDVTIEIANEYWLFSWKLFTFSWVSDEADFRNVKSTKPSYGGRVRAHVGSSIIEKQWRMFTRPQPFVSRSQHSTQWWNGGNYPFATSTSVIAEIC